MQDKIKEQSSAEAEMSYPKTWREWIYCPYLDSWGKRWAVWFIILYLIPFFPYPINPWGYVEHIYVQAFWGFPGVIALILVLWFVTLASLALFYKQAKQRGMFSGRYFAGEGE